MKRGFEQSIKHRMEQASLEELMPDFDKKLEWNNLAQKLKPKKRINLAMAWLSAAAILLIIVTCCLFLFNNDNENIKVVATELMAIPKTIQPPAIQLEVKPIAEPPVKNKETIVQTTTKRKPAHTKIIKEFAQPDTTTLLAQTTEHEASQLATDSVIRNTGKPVPQIAATTIKKPRQQALHLLDIDNEDRKFMINEAYKGNPHGILARLQNILPPAETVASTDIPTPSQIIFKR